MVALDIRLHGRVNISIHGLPFDWSRLFARQNIHHSKVVARLWCDLNFTTLCIKLMKSELKPMEGREREAWLIVETFRAQGTLSL